MNRLTKARGIFAGIALAVGIAWIQADPVIAPPGVRVLDWLWRVFVCRCLV